MLRQWDSMLGYSGHSLVLSVGSSIYATCFFSVNQLVNSVMVRVFINMSNQFSIQFATVVS